MRTGPIVVGVILLILGVGTAISGAPILGIGQTANDYCASSFWGCGADDAEAGALMVALGMALLWGGGLIALTGIGLIVAGVIAEPKPAKAPAPVAVPVQAPTRPCPACGVVVPAEAKYCNACGAAIAPVLPRASP